MELARTAGSRLHSSVTFQYNLLHKRFGSRTTTREMP